MALALAAARCGMETCLLTPPPRPGGRFYALGRTAFDFLTEAMNAPPPVAAEVRNFFLHAGGKGNNLSAPDGETLCKIVAEDELLRQLRNAIKSAGVATHAWPGMEVAECQSLKERIVLRLPSGKELSAQLLAAADGARSPLARAMRVGAAASPFGQRAVSCLMQADLPDDTAGQWFAPRDVLALLPAGDGRFALIWSLPEEEAAAYEENAERLAEKARAKTGRDIAAVEGESPRGFVLSSVRRAARTAERTAFVGDAARVIHPLAGQGLNLGLADAALLLQCWKEHARTENALSAYAFRGRRRGAMLHAMTAMLNQGGRWLSPALALASLPPLAKQIVRQANR